LKERKLAFLRFLALPGFSFLKASSAAIDAIHYCSTRIPPLPFAFEQDFSSPASLPVAGRRFPNQADPPRSTLPSRTLRKIPLLAFSPPPVRGARSDAARERRYASYPYFGKPLLPRMSCEERCLKTNLLLFPKLVLLPFGSCGCVPCDRLLLPLYLASVEARNLSFFRRRQYRSPLPIFPGLPWSNRLDCSSSLSAFFRVTAGFGETGGFRYASLLFLI